MSVLTMVVPSDGRNPFYLRLVLSSLRCAKKTLGRCPQSTKQQRFREAAKPGVKHHGGGPGLPTMLIRTGHQVAGQVAVGPEPRY